MRISDEVKVINITKRVEPVSVIPKGFVYYKAEFEFKTYPSVGYARGLVRRLIRKGWHSTEFVILRWQDYDNERQDGIFLGYIDPTHPSFL